MLYLISVSFVSFVSLLCYFCMGKNLHYYTDAIPDRLMFPLRMLNDERVFFDSSKVALQPEVDAFLSTEFINYIHVHVWIYPAKVGKKFLNLLKFDAGIKQPTAFTSTLLILEAYVILLFFLTLGWRKGQLYCKQLCRVLLMWRRSSLRLDAFLNTTVGSQLLILNIT